MGRLTIEIIDSIRKLRDRAADWDDLWMRSSVENPLAHAEPIALWMDRFAPDAPFQSLAVQEGGRLVAALPLLGQRKAKIVSAGINPSNGWSHCGQLLVDWTNPEKSKEYLDALVCGFKKLPFSILWLDEIRFENPEWVLFRETLQTRRIASQWLPRYHSAVFPLGGSFDELKLTWKKKAANRLFSLLKRYEARGYSFEVLESPAEIRENLFACFELENLGWKGNQEKGGSIIKRNVSQYFCSLLDFLASKGMLKLVLLYCEDRLIAFRFSLMGKSTGYSIKTSYDPAYRDLAPGQVILCLLNRHICENVPNIRHFDLYGEIGDHQRIWNSQERITGQIVLSVNGIVGKTFYFLYDKVMPVVRKIHAKKRLPSD